MFFLELFSKKPTSHKPSGIKSKGQQLLQVILYLSTFPKENRTRNFFLMDFSISLLQPSSYLRKFNKTIFFNWSLLGFILKRLCSRQVPHVASHPNSLYPGFSDLSWTWCTMPGHGWERVPLKVRQGAVGEEVAGLTAVETVQWVHNLGFCWAYFGTFLCIVGIF